MSLIKGNQNILSIVTYKIKQVAFFLILAHVYAIEHDVDKFVLFDLIL